MFDCRIGLGPLLRWLHRMCAKEWSHCRVSVILSIQANRTDCTARNVEGLPLCCKESTQLLSLHGVLPSLLTGLNDTELINVECVRGLRARPRDTRLATAADNHCAVALNWGLDTNAIVGHVDAHPRVESACAGSYRQVFWSNPCGLAFRGNEDVSFYSTRSVSS